MISTLEASGFVRGLREKWGQDLLNMPTLTLGAVGKLVSMLGKGLDPVENVVAVMTAIFVGRHSVLHSRPRTRGGRRLSGSIIG